MKYKVSGKKQTFQPISISIELENKWEFLEFLFRMNASAGNIIKNSGYEDVFNEDQIEDLKFRIEEFENFSSLWCDLDEYRIKNEISVD